MSFKPFGGWEYGYPDYPKIRKDVLEKARMALKP